MSPPRRIWTAGLRPLAVALAVIGALTGPAPPADAASKVMVAALGDPAPGGGVFAGPGFTGWPAAGGDGWVAFRGLVAGSRTSEALIVAHMTAPTTRLEVARIGQPAPGGDTFRQFVGRPAVNANGDVAFLALLTTSTASDEAGPLDAGIFLFRSNVLTAVARSGQVIADGTLDLLGSMDPSGEADDVVERPPALNDAGDVAFTSAIRDAETTGAVFLALADGTLHALARIGDEFDGGVFDHLGPPALNNEPRLAFRGRITADTDRPSDGEAGIDGIFTADQRSLALRVRRGALTLPLNLPLLDFEDGVALNDRGDLAFMAGPLFDPFDLDGGREDAGPGILRFAAGVVSVVAYPGSEIGTDIVTDFRLGPEVGAPLVPPTIGPDGRIAFLASLNGGSREVIALWTGIALPLVVTGGSGPDTTPAGGIYAGARSAPALDAKGGIAFLARIAGGASSEAVVFKPATGTGTPVVVGDASPADGFFAGPPFSPPLLNDHGDVVFRADVARGPSSAGIFRAREGRLATVVRAGDRSATDDGPFLDLLGQPSLNENGDVAFVAQLPGGRVGLFVAAADGIRSIAVSGSAAPGEAGTEYRSLSANPSINDDGVVAFRATTLRRDPVTNEPTRREGIFLADATGVRPVVLTGEVSPVGPPFLKLRDPVVSNLLAVAFRADLGADTLETEGIFLATPGSTSVVALERDELPGGVLVSAFSRTPAMALTGNLAFQAIRSRLDGGFTRTLGPAILRWSGRGIDLVVAKDMPGPAGGIFRSLASPAVNRHGHVAFRASFHPFTGGQRGLFLATEEELEPYALTGEVVLLPGSENRSTVRLFTAFGERLSLNAHDELAFTAGLSGRSSTSGTAVFVASRTKLDVPRVAIRFANRGRRDRIRLRLVLRTGRLANGVAPEHEPIRLTLRDANRSLWALTLAPGRMRKRGGRFVAAGPDLPTELRALRVRAGRDGIITTDVTSALLDLTGRGLQPLAPPFSVTLQVGDDAATRTLPCLPRRRSVRCSVL